MFRRVPRLFSSGTIPALIVLSSMPGLGIDSHAGVVIPYVPTPDFVVDRMLDMAEITKDDLVLDMGSGDGRIVIAAAQRYGSRGRGVEIDPKLVMESKVNAKTAGVFDRTDFIAQDMFVTPIADATVMTLYVLTASNLELRPRILKEMKPGSRIVSHQFSMGSWLADKHESYGDIQIYMWYVPAPVAGTWIVRDGDKAITLSIEQQYQEIGGTAKIGRNVVPLRQTKLKGDEIDFAIDLDDEKPLLFRGRVSNGTMTPRGAPGDTERKWQARRTTPALPLVK